MMEVLEVLLAYEILRKHGFNFPLQTADGVEVLQAPQTDLLNKKDGSRKLSTQKLTKSGTTLSVPTLIYVLEKRQIWRIKECD